MHPELLQQMIDERRRELERRSRTGALRRGRPETAEAAAPASVVVCVCARCTTTLRSTGSPSSKSRPVPTGRHVIAEVDGTVVAAMPLGQGPALADPFRRTEHLIPLLELRARQLAPETRRRGAAGWGLVRRLSRA